MKPYMKLISLCDTGCLLSTPAETRPHIERRVKTIVEKIVNGQVVSTVVDTKLEEVQ